MAEETANPLPDASDASTPIPPIDNIHSIPDLPPPEPMLPPNHTLPQVNLDAEMSEAAVRAPTPLSLPALVFPSKYSLSNQSYIQALTSTNELRSYTAHPDPGRATHRNAHPARQRYGRSGGRAPDAVESGESWGAGEAVSEREGYGGAVGGDEEVGC